LSKVQDFDESDEEEAVYLAAVQNMKTAAEAPSPSNQQKVGVLVP
jgi:hypothetical protein